MTAVDMRGRVDELADGTGGSVNAVMGAAIGPYRKSRFKLGNLPVNTTLQAYYNVDRPKDASDWQLRFQLQFLLPSFK